MSTATTSTDSIAESILREVLSDPVPQILTVDRDSPAEAPLWSAPATVPDAVVERMRRVFDANPVEEVSRWSMPWKVHKETFQRTAVYRCLDCGCEQEEYRQNPRDLPFAKECHVCAAPAIRRVTYPGEGRALDAKRFEPILVYERPEGTYSDPNHKYWWPGRNDDPPPADCPQAKAIWLDSSGGLPAIDRFIKHVGAREQEMNDVNNGLRQAHFERARDASRKQLFAQLRDRGLSGENAEKIIRDREGRYDKNTVMQQFEAIARAQGVPFNQEAAERQYERTQATRHNPDYRRREQVNFDIPVISFDASNRMNHRDPERHGWGKGRKG